MALTYIGTPARFLKPCRSVSKSKYLQGQEKDLAGKGFSQNLNKDWAKALLFLHNPIASIQKSARRPKGNNTETMKSYQNL